MLFINTLLKKIRISKGSIVVCILLAFAIGLVHLLSMEGELLGKLFVISILFIWLISGCLVYKLLLAPYFLKLSLIGKVFLVIVSFAIWLFLTWYLPEMLISKRTYEWLKQYGIYDWLMQYNF